MFYLTFLAPRLDLTQTWLTKVPVALVISHRLPLY